MLSPTHRPASRGQLFAPALRAWTVWRRNRHALARLHRLSDHQLSDIGLRRDEIDQIFAAGSTSGN